MTLADTLDLAATNGWQTTKSTATDYGDLRTEHSNLTHLIFAWWYGDTFSCAYLYKAGEFEPILTTTCDSHLTAWVRCHGSQEAAA